MKAIEEKLYIRRFIWIIPPTTKMVNNRVAKLVCVFRLDKSDLKFHSKMVLVWLMDDDREKDQRLEHHRSPPQFITVEELYKTSGVEYFQVRPIESGKNPIGIFIFYVSFIKLAVSC